ncbi:hypothetical protein EWM64_g2332 [Hericium alpestre]|uniref:Cytochrome b5 heme-binding domain-containing protein n=1 Tax=Hericium alpestre TaxID=135208 RepID=A0A4Z0A6Z0_9AGAM|nr:hypothetical protein EWM64_g2332 [Hericium alpestre]
MSPTLSLSTPVNTALLVYLLYVVQRILVPRSSLPKRDEAPTEFKKGYSWMPKSHPPVLVFTQYTPKSLVKYNGVDPEGGGRILLAIQGTVFDVTAGRNFYGPDGMYGNFAGRDASRGMAKQSFDVEMLTALDQPLDKLEDLTPEEIENMKGWNDHFSNKYIICGRLVENDVI